MKAPEDVILGEGSRPERVNAADYHGRICTFLAPVLRTTRAECIFGSVILRSRATIRQVAILAAMVLALPSSIPAHEIPSRVTVLSFIKPHGHTLTVVLRVPLEAIRDVTIPLRASEYLDIGRTEQLLPDAAMLWLAGSLEIVEGKLRIGSPRVVASRISLPSDRSFVSYDEAVAHIMGPSLPAGVDLPWRQAMMDVTIEYPIASDRSEFSIHPTFARLGLKTTTVLRFLPPGGAERAYEFQGDPGLVRLDPRWEQAAAQFVKLGFVHILDGIDHLLFLLCLVIPFRRFRPLVAIVTAFTVAHSVTLIAASMGFVPGALWFPPLIETLIAVTVVYMALENIVGARLQRRWILAFCFGLVHGFGFSFALRESLQFAGTHLTASLLSFNLGVELGQLAVIAVMAPALALLFRFGVAERVGTILLSAIVAHTAWHWMLDRGTVLRGYSFSRPAIDALFVVGAMRVAIFALLIGGAAWLVSWLMSRMQESPAKQLEIGSMMLKDDQLAATRSGS